MSTYLTISEAINGMPDRDGMSSNFSLSDVIITQSSAEVEGNVLNGKLDGNECGENGMFLSPPEGNASICGINATRFRTYIKSEYLVLSYHFKIDG